MSKESSREGAGVWELGDKLIGDARDGSGETITFVCIEVDLYRKINAVVFEDNEGVLQGLTNDFDGESLDFFVDLVFSHEYTDNFHNWRRIPKDGRS